MKAGISTVILVAFLIGVPSLHAQDAAVTSDSTFTGLVQIGKNYEKQGDQARDQILEAAKSRGNTSDLIKEEVHLYQQAIDAYTKAIAKDAQNPEVYKLRGMAFAKRDQDGNQSLITQAQGGFPTVVGAIATFGPEAIADLNRAVQLDPKDADAYYIRGRIYKLQFQNKWNVYSKLTGEQKSLSNIKPDILLAKNAVADLKKATTILQICRLPEQFAKGCRKWDSTRSKLPR